MSDRDNKGRFIAGNQAAARSNGNKGRGLGQLNKEMLERVSNLKEGYKTPDEILMDIANDPTADRALILKAASKLGDWLYSKASYVEDKEQEKLTGQQLQDKLMMKLAQFNADNNKG